MVDKKLILFMVPFILSVLLDLGQTKQILNKRQPVVSSQCSEGEYLYPGDNEKDWVCDCKPAHIYYPETQKCYQLYEQGPCNKGEILIIPPKKAIPKCWRNFCKGTQVDFKGRCVSLNENNGCPPTLTVQVNSTSLQLTCALKRDDDVNYVFENRFGEEESPTLLLTITPLNFETAPLDSIGAACLLGGKRSQANQCTAALA